MIINDMPMKKLSIAIGLVTALVSCTPQKVQKVSILGDSYSTFSGWMSPASNACYYAENTSAWHEGNDVDSVEQTWWWQAVCANKGFALERNNSYSGSTLVNTPLEGMAEETGFIYRADSLGAPDIILVFGGTNDYWNKSLERGEFQYSDWRAEDLKLFRPGTAYLLHYLQAQYPKARVLFILNDQLGQTGDDICTICSHYGIEVIRPQGIDKCPDGHPTIAGMRTIAEAVKEAMNSK